MNMETKDQESPKKLSQEQQRAVRKEILRVKRKIEENKKKIVKDKGKITRDLVADAAKIFFILTFFGFFYFAQKS